MGERDTNGWETYQKLVLSELERLSEKVDKLDADFNSMKVRLAGMAAVIGFFSGFSKLLVLVIYTFYLTF